MSQMCFLYKFTQKCEYLSIQDTSPGPNGLINRGVTVYSNSLITKITYAIEGKL